MTAPGATARVDRLAKDHEDWAPYLAVVREVVRGVEADARMLRDGAAATCSLPPHETAPVLHDAVITVDVAALERRVRRLLRVSAEHGAARALGDAPRSRALDAIGLAEAAIAHDGARLTTLADGIGAEPAALAALAHLAVVPLLQEARSAHEARVPASWDHGYCPVCGGFPTLAEARGLDRERRLRCARCGADWWTEWLCCCFCGNRDHLTLGSLVPDDGASESRRAETCERCRGYVKLLTTLTPIRPAELLLEDLATVGLDVAALEHGYRRPEGLGAPVTVRIVPGERDTRAWPRLSGLLGRS
jgi:FdhE protein